MSKRICHLILLVYFAAAARSSAGERPALMPDGNLANCKIQRWTTEDGLPQSRIACLCQTRDGYLWIGTWFGLARFDGVKFTVFKHENTPAFADDTITSLTEDVDGSLWIGTKNGLVKFSGGTFHRFTAADGLPDHVVLQLAASPTGGIWLQTGNEVVRFRGKKFTTVWKYPDGDTIHVIQADANGNLNVFLDHKWVVLSDSQVHTNQITDLEWMTAAGLGNPSDLSFAGTADGLRQLERGQTNLVYVGGWSENRASFVLRERSGDVWAQSHAKGLERFDGTIWHPVNRDEFSGDVVCAMQDAQGNLWFGTVNGLVQLRFQKIRVFTARDGLPDDNVWTVCQNRDGAIWAGTDHGPALIQSNRVETVAVFTNNSAGSIHCVWPARGGGVWVASQNEGIAKIQNGQIAEQIKDIGISGALFEDNSGCLWLSTVGGPVRRFQNGRLESPVRGTESLQDAHAFYEDQQGNLWFSARDQLAQWRDGQLSLFGQRAGLPGGRIWSLYQDGDGALWLGTEKGLVRFAGGKFFSFNEQQKMPADTVNCVLEDDDGCLWLSTLHGIYRVERGELNAVADGKSATVQPFVIGTADGLKTAESNGEVQPAGWKARDGRLWFPTGIGLAVVDPKLFSRKEIPLRAIIESVRADGVLISAIGDQTVRIAAGGQHTVGIQFTACDLAAPRQVRFRTRLVGAEQEWSLPTSDRAADYSDLSPGTYRFEVLAADAHGIESTQPAVLTFIIAPCFWQTRWFYVLCGAGLLALAVGIQAYRLRWQHRLLKLEQQRALAQERARIARDLHDDLGTALTGMALELDVLGRDAHNNSPLVERLGKTSQHIRKLAERMREVVWVVNPRCDNLRSLADFLEDQATLLLQAAGLKVRLDFPVEIPDLPVAANVRHQLALSVREAFTNLIRHARASETTVRLELTCDKLVLRIHDNGCGFDAQAELNKPHGLSNLKSRMEEIGGEFKIISAPDDGTEITFSVPVEKLKP
jgi:signal transduction histidine kinase/ligand-binding sensor domain-containing protein